MNRKRLWLAAALLLLVLVGIAVLLADWIGAHPRAVTLADGRTVTVRGISSGTSHRFVYGNFWQRIAALALPARWAARLGAVSYRNFTGQPAHVVWVDVGGAAFTPFVWVADGYGTFIPAHRLSVSRPAGNTIQPYMFFTMPTGSRKVEIVISPTDLFNLRTLAERKRIGGSVQFKNPSYIARPAWHGAPPPVVIDQDELRIHLDYCGPSREDDGMNDDESARPKIATDELLSPVERSSRTELLFRIEDRSNPDNRWSLHHLSVANELGSDWVPGSQMSQTTSTNTSLRFTGRLSTNNLWKFRLFYTRPATPAVDKLSKRATPYERIVELITQPAY